MLTPAGWEIDDFPTIEFPERTLDYMPEKNERQTNAKSKTLIFCTTYCANMDEWVNRVQRWLHGIEISGIHHDFLIMIDDGSPVLPNWPGVSICDSVDRIREINNKCIFHLKIT